MAGHDWSLGPSQNDNPLDTSTYVKSRPRYKGMPVQVPKFFLENRPR